MWSDSSRSKNPKDFSGMGGFCALTGLAWYWEYDDAEREGMQSHITEMVARPRGDDQEMDADELDADAFLEDEECLCWKHLTVTGCADGSCPFVHWDRQGMGWCPSERQTDLLRGRIQSLYDVTWDWSKIESFELDAGIFN